MKKMENKMRLWYDKPASAWVEALPLGNGTLGAMIHGDPFHENIQVNEETVWSTGEHDAVNPKAKELVKEIRECLMEEDFERADVLAKEAYHGNHQGSYQTLGNILLKFQYGERKEAGHSYEEVRSYRRELDLETAMSKVRYTVNGVNYRIESLISNPDGVFAMFMNANDGLSIQLEAALTRELNCNVSEGKHPLSLVMKGRCGDETSVQYCAMLKIIPSFEGWGKKGKAFYEKGKIFIENATNLTILFAAATDHNHTDPEQVCFERIRQAEQKGFEAIKRDHIEDYRRLFSRMSISLGKDSLDAFIPTNERLARIGDGDQDNALIALYYQYARYLMISCSRQNSVSPANLQGIWNNALNAPWGSRYTLNINTEMNYWIAEQCNLSECHEPLFRLIERLKKSGRRMAREMYGCRGFTAHHNTNIWGDASPQDDYYAATYWPMGAAWLCLHLWDHYEFTLDKEFLRKAYPTIREACEFFADFLLEDKKGRMIVCPSLSPENSYRTPNGYCTAITAGNAMDHALIRKLFDALISSADILETDAGFIGQIQEILKKIPDPAIASNDTIMEWTEEYEEVEVGHRHISHLFALHPAGQITVEGTPELAQAAVKTLERRLSHGGGHTGWSCAWIINMWSRLYKAENAYKYVHTLLAKSTYPNMFDAHPPFQIDGNFGGAAGITEMLLQSNQGMLHLLPALPEQWKEGHINGLRARGNYQVSMEWKDGVLTEALITRCLPPVNGSEDRVNDGDKKIRIKYNQLGSYIVRIGDKPISDGKIDGNVLEFDLGIGESCSLTLC